MKFEYVMFIIACWGNRIVLFNCFLAGWNNNTKHISYKHLWKIIDLFFNTLMRQIFSITQNNSKYSIPPCNWGWFIWMQFFEMMIFFMIMILNIILFFHGEKTSWSWKHNENDDRFTWNLLSKGHSIWVNIAYILHETVYPIITFYKNRSVEFYNNLKYET